MFCWHSAGSVAGHVGVSTAIQSPPRPEYALHLERPRTFPNLHSESSNALHRPPKAFRRRALYQSELPLLWQGPVGNSNGTRHCLAACLEALERRRLSEELEEEEENWRRRRRRTIGGGGGTEEDRKWRTTRTGGGEEEEEEEEAEEDMSARAETFNNILLK